MRPERNPTKWVDAWSLPGLSAADRKRIKAILLMAHAAYNRSDQDAYAFQAPMEQAFGQIAKLLFDAGLLTVELLNNELRLFVIEAGAAGYWIHFANPAEERIEISPGHFGHASSWKMFNEALSAVFRADIAEWTARLLEQEAAAIETQPPQIGPPPQSVKQPEANRRRAFVTPILEAKGWSILDWALEAEVAHATAIDYLDEKTKPFRSTRLKLAKALGIKVDELPK